MEEEPVRIGTLSEIANRLWESLKASEKAKLVDSVTSSSNLNGSDNEMAPRPALAKVQQKRSKVTQQNKADIEVVLLSSDSESEFDTGEEGLWEEVKSEGESSGGSLGVNHSGAGVAEGGRLEGDNSGTGDDSGIEHVGGEVGVNQVHVCPNSSSSPAAAPAPTEIYEPDGEDGDLWEPGEEGDDITESDEDDYEISVITSDAGDEDDEKVAVDDPSSMRCYRCPSTTTGTFQDRTKFLFHIKRHTFGENFSCPTCKRPFLSLKLCAAHEIRMHGTQIDENLFDKDDPVISAAKEFLEAKEKNQANGDPAKPDALQESNYNYFEDIFGEGKTEERDGDEDIDAGRIISSTSLLAYRGPPVEHWMQCYEIELNHGRSKSRTAQYMARIAIRQHNLMVELGRTDNKRMFNKNVGRFSDLNLRGTRFPSKETRQVEQAAPAEESPGLENAEQPMEEDVEVTENFITSSSASSSPSRPLTPGEITEDEEMEDFTRHPQQSQDQEDNADDEPGSVADWTPPPPVPILRGILQQQCHECGYPWKTQDDLRMHRDTSHPTAILADLLRTRASLPSKSGGYSEQVEVKWRRPPAPVMVSEDLDFDDLFTPIPRKSVIQKIGNPKGGKDQDRSPSHATPAPSAGRAPPILSSLLQRGCSECDYPWKSEDDLRLHRNTSHPGVPLAVLLNKKSPSSSKEVPREPSPKKTLPPPAPIMISDDEDLEVLFVKKAPGKPPIQNKKRHSSQVQRPVNRPATPSQLKEAGSAEPSPKKNLAPPAPMITSDQEEEDDLFTSVLIRVPKKRHSIKVQNLENSTPSPFMQTPGPGPSFKENLAPSAPMMISGDEDLEDLFVKKAPEKPPIQNKKRHSSQAPPPVTSTPSPLKQTAAPGPGPSTRKKRGAAVDRKIASSVPKRKRQRPTPSGKARSVGAARPGPSAKAAAKRHSPRMAYTNIYWRPQKKPYRPPAPLPDESFTPKERFLYGLGLSNSVRLDLYLKKSPSKLNIPACSVRVDRVGDVDADSDSSSS